MGKSVQEMGDIATEAFKLAVNDIKRQISTNEEAINIFGHIALMSMNICLRSCCRDNEERADFVGHFLMGLSEHNPGIIIRDMNNEELH